MFKRMILVVAVLALAAPVTSWAGTLQFYEASAGQGNTFMAVGPVSNLVLDLDYNAASAEFGGMFGFGELLIQSTGDIVFINVETNIPPLVDNFECQALGSCTSALQNSRGEFTQDPPGFPPGTTLWTAPFDVLVATGGDGSNGEFGLADLGLLTISGTQGSVELISGNYFDGFFTPQQIDPFTLAIIEPVPEPSTLVLLGAGLAGLAFIRRRSA